MAEVVARRPPAAEAPAAAVGQQEASEDASPAHSVKQIGDGPDDKEFTEALIEIAPDSIAKYIQKVQPILDAAENAFNLVVPYLEMLVRLGMWTWRRILPYHPEEFLPAFLGLMMAFFGGYYFTTIAALEALYQSGLEDLKEDLRVIYVNYRRVVRANRRDNLLDEDGDGIADVLQIDRRELASRKIKLVLTAVQPADLSKAVSDLTLTFFAIIATLKVRFAEAVTLGGGLGEAFSKFAIGTLLPPLRHMVPKEYHGWLRPVIVYTCKSIAVTFAWFLHRIISAFHSSIRGGEMFTYGILHYLQRRGIIDKCPDGGVMFFGVSMTVALLGFFWQLSQTFSLPFPLNVILFPITFLEYFLMWLVNSDLQADSFVDPVGAR